MIRLVDEPPRDDVLAQLRTWQAEIDAILDYREIDHVRPKSLYPNAVFLWSNFLWVCGRCNKLKCDRFGIVTGEQIRRLPRGTPNEPPARQ